MPNAPFIYGKYPQKAAAGLASRANISSRAKFWCDSLD
jgi:hypothetical protein